MKPANPSLNLSIADYNQVEEDSDIRCELRGNCFLYEIFI